ncbi:hypothetical protein Barb4_01739 [Bacteroidales bacterium Barb4]|nr:hypothetical protein Barb4_01739 [Bacteroidales bacterium Barb4]
MNRTITLERIIEYYDVPQLFIGKDKIGTRYLCLLFDDDHYISVQLSFNRLADFIQGKIDLRELYIHPEFEGEYFVAIQNGEVFSLNTYDKKVLPEEMLPSENYYYNVEQESTSVFEGTMIGSNIDTGKWVFKPSMERR